MRRIVINLDDELDPWLAKQVNQNETVRNALKLYKDDINTPDTIAGLKQSYTKLAKYMESKFEYNETGGAPSRHVQRNSNTGQFVVRQPSKIIGNRVGYSRGSELTQNRPFPNPPTTPCLSNWRNLLMCWRRECEDDQS